MNKTAKETAFDFLRESQVETTTQQRDLLIDAFAQFQSSPKWVDELYLLQKSITAADPFGYDVLIKDLKKQIDSIISKVETPGNVSPQAAENVDGLTKQMVIDFLDWTQKRKGEQLDELMEKENDEFTAYIETIGIETSSQLFDLYFSAPLSPVPVKEEGRFYTTDEVWKMYSEDPAYGHKSYKEFAEENGWVMVRLKAAPTPTEEQDKEVKEEDAVTFILDIQDALYAYMAKYKLRALYKKDLTDAAKYSFNQIEKRLITLPTTG